MRILLVSANTEQINMPVLPLGMACVAAAAEHAGHEVRVVNLMQPEHLEKDLRPVFCGFSPDLIGICVRNIDDQTMEPPKFLLPQVKPVITECRRQSEAPIVLGGPGYSIFPESVLEYLDADMGIQGEGEWPFLQLVDRLERSQSLEGLNGLWLPQRGLTALPHRNYLLDDFPMPRPGDHLLLPADCDPGELMVPFQTRRGCPMKCSYCSTPAIEGTRLRGRRPELVVENLRLFVDAGFRNFFFVDNVFNLPPAYARTLCEKIAEAKLGISWQAIIYPNRVDEEMVSAMAASGCRGVSLGFESASDSILSGMNKKFRACDIRRISDLFGRYGIERMGFLMLGGPGETRETVSQSVEFAESLELETVKVTAGIRIYPDTPLARAAMDKGLIGPDTNLLYPAFYQEPGLEGWLREKADELIAERPGWVG